MFKYAGQNIAMTSSSPNYKDTTSAINQLFDLWYNEYVDCNMDHVNKLSTIRSATGYTHSPYPKHPFQKSNLFQFNFQQQIIRPFHPNYYGKFIETWMCDRELCGQFLEEHVFGMRLFTDECDFMAGVHNWNTMFGM